MHVKGLAWRPLTPWVEDKKGRSIWMSWGRRQKGGSGDERCWLLVEAGGSNILRRETRDTYLVQYVGSICSYEKGLAVAPTK